MPRLSEERLAEIREEVRRQNAEVKRSLERFGADESGKSLMEWDVDAFTDLLAELDALRSERARICICGHAFVEHDDGGRCSGFAAGRCGCRDMFQDAATGPLIEALMELLEAVEESNRGKTFYEGQILRPIDAAAKKAREVLNADQS